MKELVSKIQEVYATFSTDAALQIEKGNKAAGTRARKTSLELEKLMKEFRKVSYMVVTLYLYLLMAARGRPVRRYPLTHTGSDVAAGYQTDAGPDIYTGCFEQRLLHLYDYRYHRLFLRSHGVLVDYPGRRCGSLRAEG